MMRALSLWLVCAIVVGFCAEEIVVEIEDLPHAGRFAAEGSKTTPACLLFDADYMKSPSADMLRQSVQKVAAAHREALFAIFDIGSDTGLARDVLGLAALPELRCFVGPKALFGTFNMSAVDLETFRSKQFWHALNFETQTAGVVSQDSLAEWLVTKVVGGVQHIPALEWPLDKLHREKPHHALLVCTKGSKAAECLKKHRAVLSGIRHDFHVRSAVASKDIAAKLGLSSPGGLLLFARDASAAASTRNLSFALSGPVLGHPTRFATTARLFKHNVTQADWSDAVVGPALVLSVNLSHPDTGSSKVFRSFTRLARALSVDRERKNGVHGDDNNDDDDNDDDEQNTDDASGSAVGSRIFERNAIRLFFIDQDENTAGVGSLFSLLANPQKLFKNATTPEQEKQEEDDDDDDDDDAHAPRLWIAAVAPGNSSLSIWDPRTSLESFSNFVRGQFKDLLLEAERRRLESSQTQLDGDAQSSTNSKQKQQGQHEGQQKQAAAVKMLTESLTPAMLRKQSHVALLYIREPCHMCIVANETFSAVAETLLGGAGDRSNVQFAIVNCTSHAVLCVDDHSRAFPTLVVLRKLTAADASSTASSLSSSCLPERLRSKGEIMYMGPYLAPKLRTWIADMTLDDTFAVTAKMPVHARLAITVGPGISAEGDIDDQLLLSSCVEEIAQSMIGSAAVSVVRADGQAVSGAQLDAKESKYIHSMFFSRDDGLKRTMLTSGEHPKRKVSDDGDKDGDKDKDAKKDKKKISKKPEFVYWSEIADVSKLCGGAVRLSAQRECLGSALGYVSRHSRLSLYDCGSESSVVFDGKMPVLSIIVSARNVLEDHMREQMLEMYTELSDKINMCILDSEKYPRYAASLVRGAKTGSPSKPADESGGSVYMETSDTGFPTVTTTTIPVGESRELPDFTLLMPREYQRIATLEHMTQIFSSAEIRTFVNRVLADPAAHTSLIKMQ